MKRVIVIVMLAIILAMLMSRRENLTPKCPVGKELIGSLCYSTCSPGYAPGGTGSCWMATCPADKPGTDGTRCCKQDRYGLLMTSACVPRTQVRQSSSPTWV